MIYIASPYIHSNSEIQQGRVDAVARYTAHLYIAKSTAFSPIVHSNALREQAEFPITWDWWQFHDEHILKLCSSMHILMLNGWEMSVGVTAEIEIARENNIPTTYISEYGYHEFSEANIFTKKTMRNT